MGREQIAGGDHLGDLKENAFRFSDRVDAETILARRMAAGQLRIRLHDVADIGRAYAAAQAETYPPYDGPQVQALNGPSAKSFDKAVAEGDYFRLSRVASRGTLHADLYCVPDAEIAPGQPVLRSFDLPNNSETVLLGTRFSVNEVMRSGVKVVVSEETKPAEDGKRTSQYNALRKLMGAVPFEKIEGRVEPGSVDRVRLTFVDSQKAREFFDTSCNMGDIHKRLGLELYIEGDKLFIDSHGPTLYWSAKVFLSMLFVSSDELKEDVKVMRFERIQPLEAQEGPVHTASLQFNSYEAARDYYLKISNSEAFHKRDNLALRGDCVFLIVGDTSGARSINNLCKDLAAAQLAPEAESLKEIKPNLPFAELFPKKAEDPDPGAAKRKEAMKAFLSEARKVVLSSSLTLPADLVEPYLVLDIRPSGFPAKKFGKNVALPNGITLKKVGRSDAVILSGDLKNLEEALIQLGSRHRCTGYFVGVK